MKSKAMANIGFNSEPLLSFNVKAGRLYIKVHIFSTNLLFISMHISLFSMTIFYNYYVINTDFFLNNLLIIAY